MIKEKSIYIKNIYYMLSYAYHNLQQKNYENLQTEVFENIHDLFAAILSVGIQTQLKKGLTRKYADVSESLSTLRGKIDITNSINHMIKRDNRLICCYDELSENNYMNRIIKTTAELLIKDDNVKLENRANLKRSMDYFSHVGRINPSNINWNILKYHRNNQTYRMLMNICYLVLVNLLLTTDQGKQKLAAFIDDIGTEILFEKFVLEYYKKHFPSLRPNASYVEWIIDDDNYNLLPYMKTDVTLINKDKVLIIDTKFYNKSIQTHSQYDTQKVHSNNLYQIYAYVKNKDVKKSGNVSGLLLYAKTDESITPDVDYLMNGNRISAKTLDLNCPFNLISQQLNSIVEPLFYNENIAVNS